MNTFWSISDRRIVGTGIVVQGLNADLLDGSHASLNPGAAVIPKTGGGGNIADGFLSFMGDGQAAGLFLATPLAGGTPSMRAMDVADLPAAAWDTPGRVSGRYSCGGMAPHGSNGTITLDTLYAVPFTVGSPRAFDRLAIAAIGTASAFVRLGLYADSGGMPGALLEDSGQISCAAAGDKTYTIARTLSGTVWLAAVGQGVAPSVTRMGLCFDRRISTTSPYSIGGGVAYSQTGVSGALPDPWGSTYTVVNAANTAPELWMRAT